MKKIFRSVCDKNSYIIKYIGVTVKYIEDVFKYIWDIITNCAGKLLVNMLKTITLLVCLMIFVAPALLSGWISFIPNFNYEKYIKTLEILLSGSWIWVICIVFVVILFRKEISKKLMEIKQIKGVLEFTTQADNSEVMPKSNDIIMTNSEKEKVDNNLKNTFSKKEESINSIESVLGKNDEHSMEEYKRKYEVEKIKALFFQMRLIQRNMANDTKEVLKLIYFKRMTIINYNEIETFIKAITMNYDVKKSKIEINAIISYLTNNGILETEDDDRYEITPFGTQFIKFVFEGRLPQE